MERNNELKTQTISVNHSNIQEVKKKIITQDIYDSGVMINIKILII
jgi:hypothetical protein